MLFGNEAEAPTPPNKRRAVSSRPGATSGSEPLLVSPAALQAFACGLDQLKQVNSNPMGGTASSQHQLCQSVTTLQQQHAVLASMAHATDAARDGLFEVFVEFPVHVHRPGTRLAAKALQSSINMVAYTSIR